MRTALDTNVISTIWSRQPDVNFVLERFRWAASEGGLVLSGPVYVELAGHPRATRDLVHDFVSANQIELEFELERDIWSLAADAHAADARRRRDAGVRIAPRMLADFLIGSHAQLRADRLFTLDRARYLTAFPTLKLFPA